MYIIKPHTPQSDSISDRTSVTERKTKRRDAGTSHEIFRNNTTSIEVVVKEVRSKTNSNLISEAQTSTQRDTDSNINTRKLLNEINNLKNELAKSNTMLMKTKKGFKCIIVEMKKQLDAVNRQEIETQKENLALQLENEKLKTLLDFKTNAITKFKKELNVMKRLLKFAMKSVNSTPKVPESVPLSSDTEYDEFENELKKNVRVTFATKVLESMGTTFDDSLSKSTKDSFDMKQC